MLRVFYQEGSMLRIFWQEVAGSPNFQEIMTDVFAEAAAYKLSLPAYLSIASW